MLCFLVGGCCGAGPAEAVEELVAEHVVALFDFEEQLRQGASANVELALALVQRLKVSRVETHADAPGRRSLRGPG